MTVSRILPDLHSSPERPREKTEPRADPRNAARDVPEQSRDVRAGNVTSAEKVSGDVKKDAIDTRHRNASVNPGEEGRRPPGRRSHIDTKA